LSELVFALGFAQVWSEAASQSVEYTRCAHVCTRIGETIVSRKKKKPRQRHRQPGQPHLLEPIHLVFPSNREEPTRMAAPKSLSEYHKYLSAQLTFPIKALHIEPLANGRFEIAQVVVQRLLSIEETGSDDGLQVEARFPDEICIVPLAYIQPPPTDPAWQIIFDYTSWFEERGDKIEETDEASGEEREWSIDLPRVHLRRFLSTFVYGIGAGAVWYAILKTVPGAETGTIVASSVIGSLVMVMGLASGVFTSSPRSLATQMILYGSVCLVLGAMIGALIGGLAVAYIGALPGGIVGSLIGSLLNKSQPLAKFIWGIVGAFLGGLGYAIYLDMDAARQGFGIGMIWGFGGVMLFHVLTVGLDMMLSYRGRE
jgi:hypothetical protein